MILKWQKVEQIAKLRDCCMKVTREWKDKNKKLKTKKSNWNLKNKEWREKSNWNLKNKEWREKKSRIRANWKRSRYQSNETRQIRRIESSRRIKRIRKSPEKNRLGKDSHSCQFVEDGFRNDRKNLQQNSAKGCQSQQLGHSSIIRKFVKHLTRNGNVVPTIARFASKGKWMIFNFRWISLNF